MSRSIAAQPAFSTGRMALSCLCITAMLDGAILSTRSIELGGFVLPGGAFVFPLAFACLAVVHEIYGQTASIRLAQCCVGMLLFTVVVFDATLALSYPPTDVVRGREFAHLFTAPTSAIAATILSFAVGASAGIAVLTFARKRFPWRRLVWTRLYIAPTLSQIAAAWVGLPLILGSGMSHGELLVFLVGRSVFGAMYGVFLMTLIWIAVLIIGELERPIPVEEAPHVRRRKPETTV